MKRWYRLTVAAALAVTVAVSFASKPLPERQSGRDIKGNPEVEALSSRYVVTDVQLDERGLPAFLGGDLTPVTGGGDPLQTSYAFFEENLTLYRMGSPREELRVAETSVDESGQTHITFQQHSGGVPVFTGELKTHVNAAGRLFAINGSYYDGIAVRTTPGITAAAAEQQAASDMGLGRSQCDFSSTILFVYPQDGEYHLAWRVAVAAETGEFWWYFVDAHNGEVLHRYTRVWESGPVRAAQPQPAPQLPPEQEMRLREQTPLEGADEERFLLDGQVWVRSRGETRFHRAPEATDLESHLRAIEERTAELAARTPVDMTMDLRDPAHFALVRARGYNLLPMGVEGYFHAAMLKSDTRELAEQGVPLALYPELPESMFDMSESDAYKPEREGAPTLDDVVLSQTFEGVFPATGWAVGDSLGTAGYDYWDDESCGHHGGSWGAWCADIGATTPCSHYDNYMKAYMRSPGVNLVGRSNCMLSYWWWNYSELNFDYFIEYYSADGVHWTQGEIHTGNQASWQSFSAALTGGWSTYYEMFFFLTDYSVTYEGAYVDDVSITADWAACGGIGTGTSVMGTPQNHIDVSYLPYTFWLNDRARQLNAPCWHAHNGQMAADAYIRTHSYTSNFPTNPGSICSDPDNVWVLRPAVDAQVFSGLLYDWMLSALGRNGHRGNGAQMWNTVEVATWNNNAVHYGSPYDRVGFGTVSTGHRSMAGAPDIVAHEWGHAVTEFESNLAYQRESGALNESFSDAMGTAFGFASGLDADWLHGENFNTSGAGNRSLANPRLYYQPDTYGGQYWVQQLGCTPTQYNDYCGVHTNSGVGNKFFHLLSVGGTHNGVTVTGIGVANAFAIYYRANRDYWTSTTDYMGARAGCFYVCNSLNPAWICNVADAWAAVGVGDPCERPLVCTGAVTLTNGVPYTSTTVGAPRNVLDYNCSSWYESGPEKVHRIVLTAPSTLTLALTGLSNDLDVFLLNACDDDACVAYGNNSLTYTAPAGTYYVVVDGYLGVSGPYTLTATIQLSMTVTAPNGGETWTVGSSRNITWSTNLTENVRIEIDRNYPSTWSLITSSTTNDGTHPWTVTSPTTTNARIRVSGTIHTTVSDISNGSFTIAGPPPPSITVTSPNGGENWPVGTAHNITWTSANLTQNVKIELNRNYPAGSWTTLAYSTANDGVHSWTVTSPTTSTARIRISGATTPSVTDMSDANFTISGPPPASITVLSPNGGEHWLIGSVHTIQWSSVSLPQNVRIQLNRGYPSGTWTTISSSTANDGAYLWIVSSPATSTARIRITGATTTTVGDTSNANFAIATSLAGGPGGGALDEEWGVLPTEYYLAQNYPNPFNPSTTIEFGLPEEARVRVVIYDMLGRMVATVADESFVAGIHRVEWSCRDCPAGVYVIALTGDHVNILRKAVLLK